MSEKERTLNDLRARIDEIDAQCHALLMARTQVVGQIAQAKSREQAGKAGAPVLAMRPGREADILRRLVARHHGPLPPGVVARMWREMINAQTRLQGPLRVCVYAAQNTLEIWDLARFHYGAATPLKMLDSSAAVVAAVEADPGCVGVLPAPGQVDAPAPWWTMLCEPNSQARVIAGLPFLTEARRGRASPQAWALARLTPVPSGDDRTLLAVTAEADPAAPPVSDCLTAAGFKDVRMQDEAGSQLLVSVAGFVDSDSVECIRGLKASKGVLRAIFVLGSYACPIVLEGGAARS